MDRRGKQRQIRTSDSSYRFTYQCKAAKRGKHNFLS